jgi:phospholipid-translocating ATPase
MTINDRTEKIKNVMNSLENNMEFLGITGVEDKLQEDVYQTLENIRNAGIQIWMLTGDKAETAICTAISAGIKENNKEVYIMKEIEDEMVFQEKVNIFHNLQNHILAIDSVTLMTAIQRRPKLFFSVASASSAIICCRFLDLFIF